MLSIIETVLFLKGVSVFQKVDGEGLRYLAEKAQEKIVEAGSLIFKENEMGEVMYIIRRGKVEVFQEISGRKKTLAVLGEKDFFGEMAILEEAPRSASAAASEDCLLISIDKERFHQAIFEYPEIALEVLKALARRLREANAKINS